MSWQIHRVFLRLCAPLHIGQNKIGNVQRTRPYVTGRVLWGSLTLRLTRDRFQGGGPAIPFDQYNDVGQEVHDKLAFTYFYPTTDPHGDIAPWPWEKGFRARFLSTYASTALRYPEQSAEEGTLHEVEFISPRALDTGAQVYLVGYIFAEDHAPDWVSALTRLQLGGERGYGWGRVKIETKCDWNRKALFGGQYTVTSDRWPPILKAEKAEKDIYLLAHVLAVNSEGHEPISASSEQEHLMIEPLVGRETDPYGRFGNLLSESQICYAPGGRIAAGSEFRIDRYGVWVGLK